MGLGLVAGIGAGIVAAGASNMILQFPNGVASAFFDPKILKARYGFNRLNTTLAPDPSQLIALYMQNLITFEKLADMLSIHNISLKDTGQNDWPDRLSKYWKAVIDASTPRFTVPELYYLYHSGIMKEKDWQDISKRYPWNRKQIEYLPELHYAKFDQGTIIPLYYRGYNEKPDTISLIRRLYGCNSDDASKILAGSEFLPPVSDLLRFAVRDVYNPQIVKRLRLDDEYDEISKIKPWARAVGIPETTRIYDNGVPVDRDVLRDYWRAHWQLISPTQGYEALHRLRPDRIQRYIDKIPGLQPFTFDELNDLLKMADYLPQQRKVLAATSYRVIGRIDLRRLYESDVIPLQEAYEQLQDQGYNETDAGYLRDWMKLEKDKKKDKEEEKRNKQIYGRLVKQMEAGYKEGSVKRETIIDTLLNFGYEPDEASSIVNALDIEINRKRVVTFIKMVRSEFMLGLYTGLQAVEELIQGGVTNIRASQYVIQWQRVLDRPRRLAGANTVIDWLKRGIISFDDARNRLSNLGFSNADTMLYLETADQDIRKAITLEEAKRARTEQQQAREAERLQRQMQTDIRTMQSQLRTFSPIAKMIKWVQSGLLDLGTFTQRMTLLSVPPEDQARYIIEATGGSNGQ